MIDIKAFVTSIKLIWIRQLFFTKKGLKNYTSFSFRKYICILWDWVHQYSFEILKDQILYRWIQTNYKIHIQSLTLQQTQLFCAFITLWYIFEAKPSLIKFYVKVNGLKFELIKIYGIRFINEIIDEAVIIFLVMTGFVKSIHISRLTSCNMQALFISFRH